MQAARVLLTLPLPEPFDYAIPEGETVVPGSLVEVPLGPVLRLGLVTAIIETDGTRALKTIERVFPAAPLPDAMRAFMDWTAAYTCSHPGSVLRMVVRSPSALMPSPVITVLRRGPADPKRETPARLRVLDALDDDQPVTRGDLARAAGVSASVVKGLEDAGVLMPVREIVDRPFAQPKPTGPGAHLTKDQSRVGQALRARVKTGGFDVSLIDGVTGSGKTEAYLEAIDEVLGLDPDAQILVLLPEIALTQAILSRFEARFKALPAEWHSGLSPLQRRRVWRETAQGRARIVVGARSALFLPFAKLRLIIVDEEHDGSFKQEDGVVYHARDLAIARGQREGANVVLASATPSLETLTNAARGRFHHERLFARPGTARLPDVSLVDLRQTPPERGNALSPPLIEALGETLAAGEQSLLFLNRRGYAPLVLCKACGHKLTAPGTASWLTEHRYTGRLVCHLTGYSIPKPRVCEKCGERDSLAGIGPGIERLSEEVRATFPQARIALFSSDEVNGPEDVRGLVQRMERGEIDILIGTQIVAKGHNFPGLTLVGVVDADASMKGGDLRAGERTFQLLSQVTGRAGRAEKPGRALLQTWQPEAALMEALQANDRDAFLAAEREGREAIGFPPFGRLAAMIFSFPDEAEAARLAREIVASAPSADGIDVWGPAPAPIGVLRGRWRWRYLVRSGREQNLSAYMSAWRGALKLPAKARIQIDIDPYSFM